MILEQGAKASGDFARTSNSLPNIQRRIQASIENVIASIGTAFLPAFERAAEIVQSFVSRLEVFVASNSSLIQAVGIAAAAIAGLGAVFVTTGLAISGTLAVMNALAGAFAVLTSPITLTAGAIGAVASGLTALTTISIGGFFTAWLSYSESARTLIASLGEELNKLLSIARATFQGMLDSITSGDWAGAARVAVTGLRLLGFLD